MPQRRNPDECFVHYEYTNTNEQLIEVWCPSFTATNRDPIAHSIDGHCVHLRGDIEALKWCKADFNNH